MSSNPELIKRILRLANVSQAISPSAGGIDDDLVDLDDASMMVLREKMILYGKARIATPSEVDVFPYIVALGDLDRKYNRVKFHLMGRIMTNKTRINTSDADFLLEQLTDLRNLALIAQAVILRLEKRDAGATS